MRWFSDALDVRLPPLPIGRLSATTLHLIGVGRRVHVRTGPWVLLAEDGSQVVRIHWAAQPPGLVRPQRFPDLFGDEGPAVQGDEEPGIVPTPGPAIAAAAEPPAPVGPTRAWAPAAVSAPGGGLDTLER